MHTPGINPMYQDDETIFNLLEKDFPEKIRPEAVYFYGAGCISQNVNQTVRTALSKYFQCNELFVDTDLMAAAHALCGHTAGIACIIGTGSNSCYYDGEKIVKNISPLGFMLGDEGSGAVMGKKLIADLLKNQLPEPLKEKFYSVYPYKPAEIMDHVYKKPFPNRFLAAFTRFIHANINDEYLNRMVRESFTEFFNRNVKQYPEARELPVHFTGGVAYHFSGILKETARQLGYTTGAITESPVDGLIEFHMHQS
jgi:N-acetylglucosamine kinase-like BadF-type ATPase